VWGAAHLAGTGLAHAADDATPVCLFKRVTHVPCLSCGSTRAALELLHGRPIEAWLMNPLVVTGGAAGAAWLVARLISGRTPRVELRRGEAVAAWIVGGLIAAGNWAYLIWQGR